MRALLTVAFLLGCKGGRADHGVPERCQPALAGLERAGEGKLGAPLVAICDQLTGADLDCLAAARVHADLDRCLPAVFALQTAMRD